MSTSVVSCLRARRAKARLFSGVMWAVLTAFLLMGAGCSENSTGSSGNLACGDGEAWVITKNEALAIPGVGAMLAIYGQEYAFLLNEVDAVGIIFKPNHEIVEAVQVKWTDALVENLVKMYMGEETMAEMVELMKEMIFGLVGGKDTKGWYGITATGTTWSQSANNLIMTDSDGESNTIPVTISGTTLTITDPEESVTVTLKKENIGIVKLLDDLLENPPGIPPGVGTGGDERLVLGAGEAWTYDDGDGWEEGYIFTSDGRLIDIGRYEGGDWEIEDDEGRYSASEGNITLYYSTMSIPGTYSISGDVLTLTIFGMTEVLTKTSGVNPVEPLYKSRANKKSPRLFAKKTR